MNEKKSNFSVQIFRGPMKSEAKPISFPKDIKKTIKIPVNLNYEFDTTIFRVPLKEKLLVKTTIVRLLKTDGFD